MLNINDKIYKWVEGKISDKVDLELDQSIQERNKINVDSFVQKLLEEDFNEKEIAKLRTKLLSERDFEAEFSLEEINETFLGSSLDLTSLNLYEECSTKELSVKNLLQSFDYLSPDEVVSQSSWPDTRKALQDVLLKSNQTNSALTVLKILKRIVTYNNSSKAVCEGFTALTESVIFQIDSINSHANRVEAEELYDIKEGKAVHRSSHRRRMQSPIEKDAIEILKKSIHILLSAQYGMPSLWLRFSERKLVEILSSFLHMLSISFSIERRNASGFDLVAILQPRAFWCRHWCHGSIGRGIICQEFRRNRRFFHSIVDNVILGIYASKKQHSAPSSARSKDSSSDDAANSLEIPNRSITNARFCHCFSIVAYIIRYRAGRALFPLQTSSRRRPWTAQDIVGLMVDYVIYVDRHSDLYKHSYVHHMVALGKDLLSVEAEISSARGFKSRTHR